MDSECPTQIHVAEFELTRERACVLIELDDLAAREGRPVVAKNIGWYVRRRLAQACPWSVFFEQIWASDKFETFYGNELRELLNAGLIEKFSAGGYWSYKPSLSGADVASALHDLLPRRMRRTQYKTYTEVCLAVRAGRTSRSIGCVRSMELRKESEDSE